VRRYYIFLVFCLSRREALCNFFIEELARKRIWDQKTTFKNRVEETPIVNILPAADLAVMV
jgi:hypothetical protein